MGSTTPTTDAAGGITMSGGLTSGPKIQNLTEVIAIIAVAVVIIGGTEFLLWFLDVKEFVMPRPSAIVTALFLHFGEIAPHLGYTLVELAAGYSIGASVGMMLAAVITQFPFVEKIITPYILLLVTTPMLALVPLLILNFGFGYAPRIIAVALAAGPMVMINSATGFRRVDHDKLALARSYGATTFQIFTKIRTPMAMPMIIVGLMMGAIFSVITAIGAEMSGGGFGLGSKLTSFSSTLRTAEFFGVILILAVMGICIYVFFSWLGKKLAGWEN